MATFDLMYGGYVERIAKRIQGELDRIEAVYSFELGPEFEVCLCMVLAEVLPDRFGVCRGFVTHRDGRQAGDDIIIFDRLMFPSLRGLRREDVSRKEHIPIEAVYAYIECKHTLILDNAASASSIQNASAQVAKVKALCGERERMVYTQSDPYVLRTSDKVKGPRWLPSYRNPPFGMIFSRRVARRSADRILTSYAEVHEAFLNDSGIKNERWVVDAVIGGPDNVMSPSYVDDDGKPHHALFMLEGEKNGLSCFKTPGIAFGVGVTHLLAVLDWIRLHRLPWEHMLSQSQNVLR